MSSEVADIPSVKEKVVSAQIDSPYIGLDHFEEENAPFFFGREVEERLITANLKSWRLTLLYGVSGVGKSSVLRAGVAYHVNEIARRNIARHRKPIFAAVVFSTWHDEDPASSLLKEIERVVTEVVAPSRPFPVLPMAGKDISFFPLLKIWTERLGGRLLIILDQFEEYFLYHSEENGPGVFGQQLAKLVNQSNIPVNFLISIREDALAKLDRFKAYIPILFDNYVRIDYLNSNSARDAIYKPVESFNSMLPVWEKPIRVETELVERVITKVRAGRLSLKSSEQPAGLLDQTTGNYKPQGDKVETPFLQLVMTRLWEEERLRDSTVLRLQTLEELGGARKIVAQYLEDALTKLPEIDVELAAEMFKHLVTPAGTKIALTVSDLVGYVDKPKSQVETILEHLDHIRIVRTVNSFDQPNTQRYEIFHDILAEAILKWSQERTLKQLREQKLRESNQRTRRNLILVVATTLFLLLVIAFLIITFANTKAAQTAQMAKSTAEAGAAIAQAKEIAAEEAKETAERLKIEAQTQQAIAQANAETAITARVMADNQKATAQTAAAKAQSDQAIAQNQASAAAANLNNTNATATAAASKNQDFFVASRYLSDALATSSDDPQHSALLALEATNKLQNYPTDDPYLKQATQLMRDTLKRSSYRFTLSGHKGSVIKADFSPDNKWLVTAGRDSTFRIWDVNQRKLIYTQNLSSPLNGIVFVGSIQNSFEILTAADDGWGRFWECSYNLPNVSCRDSVKYDAKGIPLTSIDISYDQQLVVGGDANGTVRVWDKNNGTEKNDLQAGTAGHSDRVNSSFFTSVFVDPQTKKHVTRVISASEDKTVKIWDFNSNQPAISLPPSDASVKDAATIDQTQLITATGLGVVRFWDLSTTTANLFFSQVIHNDAINSVFPDVSGNNPGSLFVTASTDKTAKILEWDANQKKLKVRAILAGHTAAVNTANFSPDGQLIVTASDDGTAKVWSVNNDPNVIDKMSFDELKKRFEEQASSKTLTVDEKQKYEVSLGTNSGLTPTPTPNK